MPTPIECRPTWSIICLGFAVLFWLLGCLCSSWFFIDDIKFDGFDLIDYSSAVVASVFVFSTFDPRRNSLFKKILSLASLFFGSFLFNASFTLRPSASKRSLATGWWRLWQMSPVFHHNTKLSIFSPHLLKRFPDFILVNKYRVIHFRWFIYFLKKSKQNKTGSYQLSQKFGDCSTFTTKPLVGLAVKLLTYWSTRS